jgi:hypothetical protein
MLKFGNETIAKVFAGTNEIAKVYLGGDLVYEKETGGTAEFIVWTGKTDVTETAGSSLQINASGSWNGKAYSTQQAAAGAVEAEFLTGTLREESHAIIGLINEGAAAGAGYFDLPFGIFNYLGLIYRLESGSVGLIGGTASDADVLGIRYTAGGDIEYLLNGVVIATLEDAVINYPVKAIAFLQETGSSQPSKMENCKITF